MVTAIVVIALVLAVVALGTTFARNQANAKQQRLEDAKAEARRWVERLGGQVMNLVGTDEASKQALADAVGALQRRRLADGAGHHDRAEPAGHQDRAGGPVLRPRGAPRDGPGPRSGAAGATRERERAGKVTEDRRVNVEGHDYEASPEPGDRTPHYYPGGRVAGRPVPQGWYSEPWWKPALVAGAWGVGSILLFSAMFSGMYGIPDAARVGVRLRRGPGGRGRRR